MVYAMVYIIFYYNQYIPQYINMIYKIIPYKDRNFYFLSDGEKILYIQPNYWNNETYDICTVHVPNRTTGTGYRLVDGDRDILTKIDKSIFNKYKNITNPSWASQSDIKATVPYKDMQAFLKYRKTFCKDLEVLELDNF